MAAKFFTGLPLDGPDPECVMGHGEPGLAAVDPGAVPVGTVDHSRRARPAGSRVLLGPTRTVRPVRPVRACDPDPLAGGGGRHSQDLEEAVP